MESYYILTVLILGSAVLVFFAEDFIHVFKKFFSLLLVRLYFFPFVFTAIMLSAPSQTLTVLQCVLDFYVLIVQGVTRFLPKYQIITLLCSGLIIALLSILPGWILEAISLRRDYVSSPYASNVMLFVWIPLIIIVVLT